MAEIKKFDKSQVEISGEMSAEDFALFWNKAIAKLSNEVRLDGFRPGHIPEDVLIKNVGEAAILDTAAELALQSHYPKMIVEHKIDAIGRPMVSVTKIAKGNPLGYKIVTAVIPTVTLPDYKEIAKKIFDESKTKEIVVTDKEIDDLIDDIRRRRAHIEKVTKEEAEGKLGNPIPKGGLDSQVPGSELPSFNDEFVKTLGGFEGVADFKEKMKTNLKLEKESMSKEAARYKAIEAINEKSEMELPDILVENELDKGVSQMKSEVEREGMEFDEYLKNVKKTEEDIRKESRGKAEKSVRYNLILKNIARKESIIALEADVTKEAEKLVKMYNGADLESAKVYVEDILVNNLVFKFLENYGNPVS